MMDRETDRCVVCAHEADPAIVHDVAYDPQLEGNYGAAKERVTICRACADDYDHSNRLVTCASCDRRVPLNGFWCLRDPLTGSFYCYACNDFLVQSVGHTHTVAD
jgi:hypothetical protein